MKISFTEISNSYRLILAEELSLSLFIFGKNKNYFNRQLRGKVYLENFDNLKDAFKKILQLTKKEKLSKKIILFSPSAASFDNFKNFEDRGFYFNKLVKRYLNV